MVIKRVLAFFLLATAFALSLHASESSLLGDSSSTVKEEALFHGFESYKNGEWEDAAFFLEKALSGRDIDSEAGWYMLIMSRLYTRSYSAVLADASYFMENYPESHLLSAVTYQRGRALHYLGQNDAAVLALSDFCHEYPDSELYSSALYWIAECFFDDYSFDTAKSLYERVVDEFTESPRYEDAKFKLSVIMQREREQKLLYLLKMTGEEYFSSREKYERQLKTSRTEDMIELKRQLDIANERIRILEGKPVVVSSKRAVSEEEVSALKDKSSLLGRMLEGKFGE